MTRISRTTDQPVTAVPRRRTAGPGFHLPGAEPPAPPAASQPAAPPSGILTLQEVAADGAGPLTDEQRDRQAHRRGTDMLDLLAGLQRGLLAGGDTPQTLDMLDGLLAIPTAASPGLNAVLRAIACRAAVELIRRRPNREAAS